MRIVSQDEIPPPLDLLLITGKQLFFPTIASLFNNRSTYLIIKNSLVLVHNFLFSAFFSKYEIDLSIISNYKANFVSNELVVLLSSHQSNTENR